MSRTVYLASGKWRAYADPSAALPTLELVDVSTPWNKMRTPLNAPVTELSDADLTELARRPEVRLWVDEDGIQWRVSAVGPGTLFPLPLRQRHLLFDSEQAWSGIVALPADHELGDLTHAELRALRDRIADLGGRRRRYRRPRRASPPAVLPTAPTPLAGTTSPGAGGAGTE